MNTSKSGNSTRQNGQEARGKMGETRNHMTRLWKAFLLGLAMLAAAVAIMPSQASAVKIDNPSPPDFYGELSGGFLQLSGGGGTKIFQLSLNFEELGLARPQFRGSVDSAGNITVPKSQLVFPPLSFALGADTVGISLLPTHDATGRIDPLTGRVDFRIRLRIQITGAAQGISLGGNCFVGNESNPIDIDGHTHAGTYPDATSLYQASFLPDNAGFLGGIQTGEGYSDEAGVWPSGPTPAGGPPPENIPRVAGSFRIGNDTLRAIGASGCALLDQGNGPVNDAVGLPSDPGASTAVLDFNFVVGGSRTGDNRMVQKGVKANFTAPGVSTPSWPATEVPELPTTVPATIDASSSYFKAGPNAGGRYQFDLGTGSFGAFTNTAVQSISFSTPGLRTIRVRARDADGDIDTKTRQILVVPSSDISVTSSAVGDSFRGGSNGVLKIDVKNETSSRSNTQPITVTTDLPAGTSFVSSSAPTGWTCNNAAQTVTCTLPAGELAASSTESIEVTVAVDAGAANPLSSTVSATQVGDPVAGNNSSAISIPVKKTDLALAISHTGNVVANGTVVYNVDIENLGDAPTVGNTVVNVTLPAGMSFRNAGSGGTGWGCVTGATQQDVTCTSANVIAGESDAAPLAIKAKVDRTANGTLSTSATVTAQGDVNAFSGANTDTDDAEILVLPDLALTSSVTGNFIVGDPGELKLTATNESVLPIDGPTTLTTDLPDGVTVDSVTGTDWDCAATVSGSSEISCSYADGLDPEESAPVVTAVLDVDHAAYPATSISSSLANEDDGFADNNTASSDVTVRRLDVNIAKSAVRSFSVGIEGQYRLSVSNVGDAATVGQIKVIDELPAELKLAGVSGGGWDCSASVVGQQHIECVTNSSVTAGSSAAVINVRVDVLDAAADAGEVSNTATVDTTRDDRAVEGDSPVTGNNSSTAITKAVSVDLSVESSHGTTFRVGTVQSYSLKVRNVGFFGTVAGQPVTVTDTLPAGMTPNVDDIFTDRPGWSCDAEGQVVTCVLEAPDSATSALVRGATAVIDIPVTIGDAAVDPSINVAEVSTQKDDSIERSPNNRTEDSTHVTRIDLATTASQSIPARAGGIGETTVNVVNNGTAATAEPTVVTIPLPAGASYRATGSTIAGWQCASPGAGTQITCTHQPSIAPNGSAPPLKVRTNVTTGAPSEWTTNVTVRTNGEAPERLADNDVSIEQTLEKIDLKMLKSHVSGGIKSGATGQYTLAVQNIGNVASTGTTTVTETVDSTFGSASASGPGWTCQVPGQALTCTRTASVPAGETTPPITVKFSVPGDASGTRNSTATLSNPSDPYTGNNSASDPITIVAAADVTVTSNQPEALRVGDVKTISYEVRNVGTDSTSGSPSVRLKITMPDTLEPVEATSGDGWECSQGNGETPYFDCVLPSELAPGGTSVLNAKVRVLPNDVGQTATLARVSTPGEANLSNNSALAASDVTGIDLAATVTAPVNEHLDAGVITRRNVNVTNTGSSPTTGPIRVEIPLPDGVQWGNTPPYGSGWGCAMPATPGRTIICDRTDVIGAGASAPALAIDLKPSRSNAPSVTIDYTVITEGDGNDTNDTATREDEVRFVPETTITNAPTGASESRTATIEFESDDEEATFECRLDGAAYEACESPWVLNSVPIGGHSATVRAVNEFGSADATPAEANWTVTSTPDTGPSVPIKAKLTGGSLSLAALGEVPLPAGQVTLDGRLFENGSWSNPMEGIKFEPIEQQLEIEQIGGAADIKILLSATGPGSGKLPAGGGPATFNLPVQAKIEVSLGSLVLLGPETDCALRPVTFDLAGTYDEAAKTVTVSSNNVAFPAVSAGCGGLGNTVNTQLELPRDDIGMSMTFALEKGADQPDPCPEGKTGTPPNCVDIPAGTAQLAAPTVKTKKKVKSGKSTTITASVRNTGTAAASNVKVCLSLKKAKKLAKGKAKRCKTIKSIAAGGTGSAKFPVKTKKIKTKKAKLNYSVSASAAGLAKPKNYVGHVTLIKQ